MFKIIYRDLFVGVAVTLVCVLFVVLILISAPISALLVGLCVVLTILALLGSMGLWGIDVDLVSVIFVVLAIGLSVDYSAHVGHCFQTKRGTRDERVRLTLADIGPAILKGGGSTFLAIMFLAASQSLVFQTMFKQFFITISFGLAHGMILLPVLLSLVGLEAFSHDFDLDLGK